MKKYLSRILSYIIIICIALILNSLYGNVILTILFTLIAIGIFKLYKKFRNELLLSIVAFIFSFLTFLVICSDFIYNSDWINISFLVLCPIQSIIFLFTHGIFLFNRFLWLLWQTICFNFIQFILATVVLKKLLTKKIKNTIYWINMLLIVLSYISIIIWIIYSFSNY